jgi:hypothetical protein
MRGCVSRTGLVMAALLGILLLVPAAPALHVDGVKILMDVRPGMTYTYPMGVSIDEKDPATAIAVEVMGFGQSDDGSYNQVLPADDTGPHSARPFVSVEEPLIRLGPGGGRPFNATIRVPMDATPGGYYATIYIHPQAEAVGSSGAGVVTAILVPVMLTVQGGTLAETGTITGIRAGEPAQVLVTLENTGNHHFYGAVAGVTVTDAAGNTVATGSSKPSVWALVPGGKMSLKVPLSPALPPGSYTVKAEAWNGQGGPLLGTKTASITIGPSTGTVAVSSPAGAVATPASLPATGVPGPDPVAITAFISAAILLWSVRSRR